MSREIWTGRITGEPKISIFTNSKTGEDFKVAEFSIFKADPYTKTESGLWNSTAKKIRAVGKIANEIEEKFNSGELKVGSSISLCGKYMISSFQNKEGKEISYEFLKPERIDTTNEIQSEMNNLLRAYSFGKINSISEGLNEDFPDIENIEEMDLSDEMELGQEEDISVER